MVNFLRNLFFFFLGHKYNLVRSLLIFFFNFFDHFIAHNWGPLWCENSSLASVPAIPGHQFKRSIASSLAEQIIRPFPILFPFLFNFWPYAMGKKILSHWHPLSHWYPYIDVYFLYYLLSFVKRDKKIEEVRTSYNKLLFIMAGQFIYIKGSPKSELSFNYSYYMYIY